MCNPAVSVIVPVYNAEARLGRCVDSILAQSVKELEVILVDDGSKDGSGAMCDAYARQDRRVRVLHIANGGVSNARNQGLAVMQGEYGMFVDADDFVSPELAERMLNARRETGADVVLCGHHICSPNEGFRPDDRPGTPEVMRIPEDFCYTAPYADGNVWAALFPKALLGTFDRDLYVGEDAVFMAKVLKKAKTAAYLPDRLYYYVIYPESANHGGFTEKRVTEITAWKRILELFSGYPEAFLLEIRARMAAAYCAGVRTMLLQGNESSASYREYLHHARKLLGTYLRSRTGASHKAAYAGFCAAPRLMAAVYRCAKK